MKTIVMFILVLLVTLNAAAQVAPVAQLNCCRCLDGPASSLNLNTGQASPADQLWTVNGVAATTSASPNGNWLTSIPTGWIEPAVSSAGPFRYKTSFIVPNCTIPMAVSLSGRFAADNNGVVTLDGTTVLASCTGNNCFSSSGGAPFTFNVPSIAPGFHTLQVDVNNLNGVTGLSVQATLRAVLPPMRALSRHRLVRWRQLPDRPSANRHERVYLQQQLLLHAGIWKSMPAAWKLV